MEMSNILGKKIEALRKQKKISQADLAKIIGVSRASISLYEKGTGNPSYKVLVKLADALQADLNDFVPVSEGREGINEKVANALSVVRSTSDAVSGARATWIKAVTGFEDTYVEVPFVPPIDYEFITTSYEDEIEGYIPRYGDGKSTIHFPTLSVLCRPGVDYSSAIVVVVRGNSMSPRYPDMSRYVLHGVNDKNAWQYATGVHGIMIGKKLLLIRRITSNTNGLLVLTSDSTGDQTTIALADVDWMWKVGQAVYMPAED
jgi:transcriptional regulator with XRE-family HTH domain